MHYDLIVIGAGPAGYLGAERATESGMETLLIEKNKLGGVCLNVGCIPSKTLLNSAKIFDKALHGEKYGIEVDGIKLTHGKVIERKNKVVHALVSGVRAALEKKNIDYKEGEAHIIGINENGYLVELEDQKYSAEKLLIATGSKPIIPEINGLKESIKNEFVLTNSEILSLAEVPDKLTIIGGGVIGLEMASYYNSAGSDVTVIEMLNHIGGNIDEDISNILLENYIQKGISFELEAKVIGFDFKNNEIIYEKDDDEKRIKSDKSLLSIGRKPVLENLGLENIGVEVENGHIKVDETGKTNLPGVYAAGDVNGKSLLAHTAYREAEVCVNNMVGKKDYMRYKAVPQVLYTDPEVVSIGETIKTAKEKNIDFEVKQLPMMYSGRYVAETENKSGICKILIDNKHKTLLGLHMISHNASEIIYGAGIMIENELRLKEIKEIIFPHPTVSEIIRETIFEF